MSGQERVSIVPIPAGESLLRETPDPEGSTVKAEGQRRKSDSGLLPPPEHFVAVGIVISRRKLYADALAFCIDHVICVTGVRVRPFHYSRGRRDASQYGAFQALRMATHEHILPWNSFSNALQRYDRANGMRVGCQ